MLLAFQETSCRNIQGLKQAYALLGGKMQKRGAVPGVYLVDLFDGGDLMNIHDPDSNSGIMFQLYKDSIDIMQLHITLGRRKKGLAQNLLLPLMKYNEARNKLKFSLFSVNDKFWEHLRRKYPRFLWDIAWTKDQPVVLYYSHAELLGTWPEVYKY